MPDRTLFCRRRASASMARSQRTIDPGIANKTVNNRGATLRQVAEHAGVSLATASYALGSGRRSVSEPTRRRVIDATQELGYQPRRRGRYGTSRLSIAAIVPDATNSFFSETVRGIQEVVRSHGHRLVVASSGDDLDAEQDLVSYFRGKSDGLIMAPAGVVGPAVTDMDAGPVPVVLIDRDGAAPSISSVVMDNVGSAHRATRVLIESGHDRVAIINGPVSVNTARDRLTGFRRAMEEAGIPVRDDYVRSSDFSFEGGRRAAQDLLTLNVPPRAIFSASARLTSGLLFTLKEHGLAWPEDVAVVGFGDAVWASLVRPAITVVEQPAAELGRTAALLLLARKRDPRTSQHIILDSQLVVRDSHWGGAQRRLRAK